jgi:AcrR family transcriptional regulator
VTSAELATRKRNSTATRANLLDAAMKQFARQSYDAVGLRDIAAEAGVDVSLVSRYFGGKEELFREVLAACPGPDRIFNGAHEDFGERVSRMLVDEPQADGKLEVISILILSASSPVACPIIRQSGEERFFGPFAQWLGGVDADVRARVAAGVIKGVAVDRIIQDDFGLNARERTRFRKRLARVLQTAIEP